MWKNVQHSQFFVDLANLPSKYSMFSEFPILFYFNKKNFFVIWANFFLDSWYLLTTCPSKIVCARVDSEEDIWEITQKRWVLCTLHADRFGHTTYHFPATVQMHWPCSDIVHSLSEWKDKGHNHIQSHFLIKLGWVGMKSLWMRIMPRMIRVHSASVRPAWDNVSNIVLPRCGVIATIGPGSSSWTTTWTRTTRLHRSSSPLLPDLNCLTYF